MSIRDQVESLYEWLHQHVDADLFATLNFGTYKNKRRASRAEVTEALSAMFDPIPYDPGRYEFEWLGRDGAGGSYLVWIRPSDEADPPLVYFGVGGAHAVLTRCAWEWPEILAHGVGCEEYQWSDAEQAGCAPVHPEENELLSIAPEDFAIEAVKRFRAAVEEELGPIRTLEVLLQGRQPLSKEFRGWVASMRTARNQRR